MGVVLTNCRVYGSEEADTVAIENGRVCYVGRWTRLDSKLVVKKVLDLQGAMVLPGLVDSHMHLQSTALARMGLDLRGLQSIEELKELVEAKARSLGEGRWIIGRGWDQELFKEGRLPDRMDLDEAAPKNPVLLYRVCGHIAVANTLALRKAGLLEKNKDGVLREGEVGLVAKHIPKLKVEELAEAIYETLLEASRLGLTSLHCMSVSKSEFEALRVLKSRIGNLPLRLFIYFKPNLVDYMEEARRSEDGCLKVKGLKLLTDGSLGGWTAALTEPYIDNPSSRGVLLLSKDRLAYYMRMAESKRFQLAVHAIGDRAINLVLETASKLKLDRRLLRVEHVSLTPPETLKLLEEYRPMVTVQPRFTVTDWWVDKRLGPRVRYVYMFKTLIAMGLKVAGGSDSPVEPLSPWLGLEAAVTRGLLAKHGLDEALTLDEALRIYTAGGDEVSLETLHGPYKGLRADLIAIDRLDSRTLSSVNVLMTMVDGKIVYMDPSLGKA
ncbi:hypothetical protein DRO58_04885 [Candidatus Bathyarchaeota archaeon]|nr:MAG: hypothetical protein DRO58_04885 [Candidatus Bathyarchaeota archaeon]